MRSPYRRGRPRRWMACGLSVVASAAAFVAGALVPAQAAAQSSAKKCTDLRVEPSVDSAHVIPDTGVKPGREPQITVRQLNAAGKPDPGVPALRATLKSGLTAGPGRGWTIVSLARDTSYRAEYSNTERGGSSCVLEFRTQDSPVDIARLPDFVTDRVKKPLPFPDECRWTFYPTADGVRATVNGNGSGRPKSWSLRIRWRSVDPPGRWEERTINGKAFTGQKPLAARPKLNQTPPTGASALGKKTVDIGDGREIPTAEVLQLNPDTRYEYRIYDDACPQVRGRVQDGEFRTLRPGDHDWADVTELGAREVTMAIRSNGSAHKGRAYELQWWRAGDADRDPTVGGKPANSVKGTIGKAATQTLRSLMPNTRYGYRLNVGGAPGRVEGFRTLNPVDTLPATDVETDSATLRGALDTGGGRTLSDFANTQFQYGTDLEMKDTTTQSAERKARMSRTVTGLLPGRLYFYRAVAKIDGETVYGRIRTFRTLYRPDVGRTDPCRDLARGKTTVTRHVIWVDPTETSAGSVKATVDGKPMRIVVVCAPDTTLLASPLKNLVTDPDQPANLKNEQDKYRYFAHKGKDLTCDANNPRNLSATERTVTSYSVDWVVVGQTALALAKTGLALYGLTNVPTLPAPLPEVPEDEEDDPDRQAAVAKHEEQVKKFENFRRKYQGYSSPKRPNMGEALANLAGVESPIVKQSQTLGFGVGMALEKDPIQRSMLPLAANQHDAGEWEPNHVTTRQGAQATHDPAAENRRYEQPSMSFEQRFGPNGTEGTHSAGQDIPLGSRLGKTPFTYNGEDDREFFEFPAGDNERRLREGGVDTSKVIEGDAKRTGSQAYRIFHRFGLHSVNREGNLSGPALARTEWYADVPESRFWILCTNDTTSASIAPSVELQSDDLEKAKVTVADVQPSQPAAFALPRVAGAQGFAQSWADVRVADTEWPIAGFATALTGSSDGGSTPTNEDVYAQADRDARPDADDGDGGERAGVGEPGEAVQYPRSRQPDRAVDPGVAHRDPVYYRHYSAADLREALGGKKRGTVYFHVRTISSGGSASPVATSPVVVDLRTPGAPKDLRVNGGAADAIWSNQNRFNVSFKLGNGDIDPTQVCYSINVAGRWEGPTCETVADTVGVEPDTVDLPDVKIPGDPESGSYPVRVWTRVKVGEVPEVFNDSAKVDAVLRLSDAAPPVPERVSARLSEGSLTVTWDNPKVAQGRPPVRAAQVQIEGSPSEEVKVDGPRGEWSTSTPPETAAEHVVRVWFVDEAGNGSAENAGTTKFAVVPRVEFERTPPDPAEKGAQTRFDFKVVNPAGASTPYLFECRLIGPDRSADKCESPFVYFNAATSSHTLPAGPQEFQVRACLPAHGPCGAWTGHQWTIGSRAAPPNVKVTARPEDSTDATSATVSFTADQPGSVFKCRLDGKGDGGFEQCSSPHELSNLEPGEHTLQIVASKDGVTGPPATVRWQVLAPEKPEPPVKPPEVSITQAPEKETSETTARFAFASTENDAKLECRLDSDADSDFAACASPHTFDRLAVGRHRFAVRATNKGGTSRPVEYSWTITPPEVDLNGKGGTQLKSPTQYVISPKVLRERAGTRARPDTIKSAAGKDYDAAGGANWTGAPLASRTVAYVRKGIRATYKQGAATRFNLFVDSGDRAGNAVQARVSYDFDGDGAFDRVETYAAFRTNAKPGNQRYRETSGAGLLGNPGAGFADMTKGTVKLEVWSAAGRDPSTLRASASAAEGQQSAVVLPYRSGT
jgi:hypothetical protein